MAHELTGFAQTRQTGDMRRESGAKGHTLWFPGCYRAPAWPLASAFTGQGQEARRLLVHWAHHCPIFVVPWKVSGHGSHVWWLGKVRGTAQLRRLHILSSKALCTGYQRGLHVLKPIHQLHFCCIFCNKNQLLLVCSPQRNPPTHGGCRRVFC